MRVSKWTWAGAGVFGAACVAASTWWGATLHYERRVDALREEIAQRGWPTENAEVLGGALATTRRSPLDAALAQLCEFPRRKGSDFAPPLRDLLRARGAATARGVTWTSDLERAVTALDTPEFDDFLATLDAVLASGEPCPVSRIGPGMLVANLREGMFVGALRFVRIHGEAALHGGDVDAAARDAERLLATAEWLAALPTPLAFPMSRSPRLLGLSLLRDVVGTHGELAESRRAALLALVERARPDEELVRALDIERVLHADRVFELLGSPSRERWLDDAQLPMEGAAIARPLFARAEALALEASIGFRAHAERTPFALPEDLDTTDWPDVAIRSVATLSSYFEGLADERRALDLARIALAGLPPEDARAPRDPLTGAAYRLASFDGSAVLTATPRRKDHGWSWPLAWPLRG